jgi:hypothetical protein
MPPAPVGYHVNRGGIPHHAHDFIDILESKPITRWTTICACLTRNSGKLWLLFLNLHQLGFTVCILFFGFSCFLLSWLIVASTFMPPVAGVLMAVAGLGYMTYSFAGFVSPPRRSVCQPTPWHWTAS